MQENISVCKQPKNICISDKPPMRVHSNTVSLQPSRYSALEKEHAMSSVSSVMPPLLRPVFPFPSFNPVQTECIDAFSTDKNMLISAPTGSGKTAIFEMAICRLLERQLKATPSHKLGPTGLGSKIVYLAPIKALCTEKALEWQAKFGPFGVQVLLCTGDVGSMPSSLASSLRNADLILSTAEKWDSVTRNPKGISTRSRNGLSETVSLLLIDEIHHLGDTRGSALEAVVTRMLMTSDDLDRSFRDVAFESHSLRVVAASATIPNVHDIASWIRAPSECVKVFNESYRPVPLEYKVLGYQVKNKWTFSKYLDDRLLQVIQRYSSGKPALIFCPSRKETRTSASAFLENVLKQSFGREGNSILLNHLSSAERAELHRIGNECKDKTNRCLVKNGIAIHNADLVLEDRVAIEGLFRKSLIRVLFTTSTLAQGVNLPARLVVLKGTSVYQAGCLQEYDRNLVMQMLGRAGRPQYDDKGVAVIMTPMSNVRLYEAICKGEHELVLSQLQPRLREHINAEVTRRVITDVPSALSFIKSTFLWVQMNATHARTSAIKSLDEQLKRLVVEVLGDLVKIDLLIYDDDDFGISSTSSGDIMARYYMNYDTMKLFAVEMNKATSPSEALRLLCNCEELMSGLCLRRAEKKKLNELNSIVKYPIVGKVKSVQDKAIILLQTALSSSPDVLAQEAGLRNDSLRLVQAASRVSKCLTAYLLEREKKGAFTPVHSCLEVARALQQQVLWDGASILRQIPGIGVGYGKLLASSGIANIKTLAMTDPRRLENILKKNPPFGNEILKSLASLPKFEVQIDADEPSRNENISVTLKIQNAAWSPNVKPKTQKGSTGFILIGTHSEEVLVLETFDVTRLPLNRTYYLGKTQNMRHRSCWVDFIVGSATFIGTDFCERIRLLRESANKMLPTDEKNADTVLNEQSIELTDGLHRNSKDGSNRACKHSCVDKKTCKHKCCKNEPNGFVKTSHPAGNSPSAQAGSQDHYADTRQNLMHLQRLSRPIAGAFATKRLKTGVAAVEVSSFAEGAMSFASIPADIQESASKSPEQLTIVPVDAMPPPYTADDLKWKEKIVANAEISSPGKRRSQRKDKGKSSVDSKDPFSALPQGQSDNPFGGFLTAQGKRMLENMFD